MYVMYVLFQPTEFVFRLLGKIFKSLEAARVSNRIPK